MLEQMLKTPLAGAYQNITTLLPMPTFLGYPRDGLFAGKMIKRILINGQESTKVRAASSFGMNYYTPSPPK